MRFFPLKVTASRRPIELAILSIHSAIPIVTLLPNVQKSTSSSATPPKLRRKALLIGVNGDFATATTTEEDNEWTDSEDEESHSQAAGSYRTRSDTVSPLKGPREDVNGLRRLLIGALDINFVIGHYVKLSNALGPADHYGFGEEDITLLVDDGDDSHVQPTRDNILSAIENFVSDAQPFDQLVFAFAGHGYQKKAKEEDEEEDGFNEYIRASCGKGIKDNVLKQKLVDPLHPTCKLTAIFDSCHSATLLDLEHSKCNRVFMPWVNKGKRRSRTLQYQTKKQCGLMPDRKQRSRTSGSTFGSLSIQPYPSEGCKTHSRSSLRVQSLGDSIHRNRRSKPRHTRASVLSQDSVPESVTTSAPKLSQPIPRRPQRKPKFLTIDVQRNSIKPPDDNDGTQPTRFLDNVGDIVESPTAIRFGSPLPRFSCDGETCMSRQKEDGHCQMADVICLSSSQDGEPTWEDGKGRSMVSHLIKILKKQRNPTLRNLMTEIGLKIHQSNCRLHERALKFRKEMRARGAMARSNSSEQAHITEDNRHSDLEITHFQRPELSSRIPLDMDERRWVL